MNYIITLFYLWILDSFFYTFFKKRKVHSALRICIWSIFYLLHYYGLTLISNPYLTLILSSLLIMLVCKILYIGSTRRTLYICLLGQTVAMLIEIITSYFLTYLNYTQRGYLSVGSVISKLVMMAIVHAIVILKYQTAHNEPSTFYWFLLFVTTLSSISIAWILFSISELPSSILIISTLALLCVNMSHFIIYNKLSETTNVLLKSHVLQQQINHYQTQFSFQKMQNNALQKERHNLKNQLISIRGFAVQNQNQNIIRFVNKLLNDQEFGLTTPIICNNLLIATLLNSKSAIARENNISFSLDLKVPSAIPFDDVDLCVLIGNALDNAFDATISSNSVNPFIDVSIHYINGCLYCHFSNPYSHTLYPDDNYYFRSTKRAQHKQGYGLQSIKYIVEKYNGTIEIITKESIFSLKLFLYEKEITDL